MTIPIALLSVLLSVAAVEPSPTSTTNAELPHAAERQDWPAVARLLNEGSPPNAAQPDGTTALHWAAYWGDTPATEQLLNRGADPDAATRYNVRPLSIAAEAGNATLVEALLDAGADPNARLAGGSTALMIAARTGDADCVRLLLAHGADMNAVDRSKQTSLMWAAAEGNLAAVNALLSAGADLEAASRSDFTALRFAAREGKREVVRRLLKAGADVNGVMEPKWTGGRAPRRGMSPLMLAVESGHFQLAMDLVAAGADPNDQRSGYAPLHAVTWVRKTNRGDDPSGDPPPRGSGDLTSLGFVRQIVGAGADVNLRLEEGKGGRAVLNHRDATPLLLAGKTADLPLIELLVKLGADPLQPNAEGCTPLMAAAGVGVRAVGEEAGAEDEVLDTIEFLIGLGAEVNTVDQNLETAMHGAAYRNFPRVVELLHQRGADPTIWNHKNKAGWTPMMIAKGHRPGSFKPSPTTMKAIQAALTPVAGED